MFRLPLVVLCLGLTACAAVPPEIPDGPDSTGSPVPGAFRMDFDGADPMRVWGLDISAEAIAINGAEVAGAPGPDGGDALQFPAVAWENEEESELPTAPGLVIVLRGSGLPDPRERDFSFGAELRLDEASTSDADDGDNVLQRGLARDVNQYKLQVDVGRPSCVVAGPGGRYAAKLKGKLGTGWYRVRCDKVGDTLTLQVASLESDGTEPETVTVAAAPGALSFDPATPLSIGRKVTAAGAPVINKPDQFNGALGSVWVAVEQGEPGDQPSE